MKTLLILAALAASLSAQQAPATAKIEPIPVAASMVTPAPNADAPLTLTVEQKLALREDERMAVRAEQMLNDAIQRYQASPEYKRLEFTAIQAAEQLRQSVSRVMTAIGCPDCKIDANTWAITRPPKAEEKPKEQVK